MRSIMTGYMKQHLKTESYVNNKLIGEQPIDDPFATVTIVIGWSLWKWLEILFWRKREIEVRVRINGDGVAQKRWFEGVDVCERCEGTKIGYPHDGSNADDPGYHHGDERFCHNCYYEIPEPEHMANAVNRISKEEAIENLSDKDHPGYIGEWV